MAVTGIIVAGGASRRMGQDKALLQVAGQTQLERTQAMLREAVASKLLSVATRTVLLVTKSPRKGRSAVCLACCPIAHMRPWCWYLWICHY